MTLSAPAQTTNLERKDVSEPEFADVFYRLDSGKLVPLERQAATRSSNSRGFIVVSTKTAFEFDGSKSPIRFAGGQSLEFVVRSYLATSTFDPNTAYLLHKLNSKKRTRELVTMAGRISPVGFSSKTNMIGAAVPVEFSKYGDASLRMTTTQLAAGEYAIGPPYGPTVFCFGVD